MEKTEDIRRPWRRRVAAALRRTSLRSSCGIAAGNGADAVEEPIFVPRRRDQYRNEEISFRRRPRHSRGRSLPPRHRYPCAERRRTGYGPPAPAPAPGARMRRRPPETQEGRVPRSEERKKLSSYGFATSSSGGGGDETEWTSLFSSMSFSSGSPELYYSSSCRCSRRGDNKKKMKNRPARRHRRRRREEADGEESGRRIRLGDGLRQRRHRRRRREEADGEGSGRGSSLEDGFGPLVSVSVSSSPSLSSLAAAAEEELQAEEEKMGFAVEIKQSSDPREDFRSSMVEMIMEKQVFGSGEQEKLLLRYLWLNSPRHHAVILEVFSDIRETLFG